MNADVISRIDYCNAVLTDVHNVYLRQLQGVRKSYNSDVLHWLPIRERVEFKQCVLMFNCLHNLIPSYLSTMCQRVAENPGHH